MKTKTITIQFKNQSFAVEFTGCIYHEETRDCPADYERAEVIKLQWLKDSEIVDVTDLLKAGIIDAEDLDDTIFEELEEIRNEYNG